MRLFGLIGFPLTHSFSKKYFEEKFVNERIVDARFENFSFEDIHQITSIVAQQPRLKGFAITIPHKKNIIPFLYNSSKAVKQIGACNCVKIIDGKWYGFNTDVLGFKQSFIQQLQSYHTKALVLGTGGAAAAVLFVLKELGISYTMVSRQKNATYLLYEELNKEILEEYSIIINCSPVGTFPNVEEAPAIPYQYITSKHYLYDLVYNPPLTTFLQQGNAKGCTIKNGYDMLAIQAEENWKIWNENVLP